MNRATTTFGSLLLATTLAAPVLAQPGPGRGPGPEAIIEAMDADGDGRLSPAEFEPPRRGPGAELRVAADSDGDGRISRAEHDAMQAQRVQRTADRADALFEAMDADGDGYVTDEELREQAFRRLDADKDGYLTAGEFANLRDRLPGKPGKVSRSD